MTTKTKPLIPGRTEAQVTEGVLDALRSLGLDPERSNVMVATNAKGRPVACGRKSDPDYQGTIPRGPNRGKRWRIEIKREGFDPTRISGREKQAHWDRQIARIRECCARGELAFWVNDAAQVLHAMGRILEGCWVVIDEDGWPFVTDEVEDVANG